MININATSSLETVTAEARALACRVINFNRNKQGIDEDRRALRDWFLADSSRDPKDIVIPGVSLDLIRKRTALDA